MPDTSTKAPAGTALRIRAGGRSSPSSHRSSLGSLAAGVLEAWRGPAAATRAVPRRLRRAGPAGRRRAVLQRRRCTRSASRSSAVLWLIVGAVAARRTTRNPMATWPDYWRTYCLARRRDLGRRRGRPGGSPLRGRRCPGLSVALTRHQRRIASSLAGPMPRTCFELVDRGERPFVDRWSTIACAVAGPIPGSSSSSPAVARLRSRVRPGRGRRPAGGATAARDRSPVTARRPARRRRAARRGSARRGRRRERSAGSVEGGVNPRSGRQLVDAGPDDGAGDMDDEGRRRAVDGGRLVVDVGPSASTTSSARRTAAQPRSAAPACAAATSRRRRRRRS